MSTKVRSHAKINLGLGIGAPRPDGFHSLTTVYQTLELHDVVTVTAKPAVGSDVPLFLIGGTVLGLDRGQEVYPLPDIEPVWCVVATPEVGVSTRRPFATGTPSAPPRV
jgi:4-diphosphocytidyl-2C-methyl-D-erythritol kinase